MTYIKVIGLVSVVVAAIYLQEYHHVLLDVIASGFLTISSLTHNIVQSASEVSTSASNEASDILFTLEQLQNYSSSGKTGKLYLSILGSVFDVTKGKKFYGDGGEYSFFTGRDASRAFISGDFTESGLSDDILMLSPQEIKGVKKWHSFYEKEYKYVGKLIGRFYNTQGFKTPYLLQVEKIIVEAVKKELESDEEKLKYPPCNTEWSASKGGRVWCSNKSGGISREWIGVPRKLFVVGSSTPRCVCIRHPNESHSKESSLNDPKLEEYPGCHKDAISCSIET